MNSHNKRPETISLTIAVLSTSILFLAVLFDSFVIRTPLFWISYCSHTISVIFSLISWAILRLIRLEKKEEEERLHLKETYPSEELFNDSEINTNSIAESRKVIERYFIPLGSVAMGMILMSLGYHFFQSSSPFDASTIHPEALRIAGASFFFFLFCLFLGNFSIGVSLDQKSLLLRPPGQWILFSSFVYILCAILFSLSHFNLGSWVNFAFKSLWVLLIVLGLELIVKVIIDLYRPRNEHSKEIAVFESVILDFFLKPHKIVDTITETLDYQFGFNVSRTRAFRFVEGAVFPYLILLVLLLYLLDGVVIVGTNERGLRERFGKPGEQHSLEPGLYLKLPRPFESIKKFPVKQIRKIYVGFSHESDFPETLDAHEKDSMARHHGQGVVLWNNQHYREEERFLVASSDQRRDEQEVLQRPPPSDANHEIVPVNIMAAAIPVYYKIDEDKLYDFAYNHKNPEKILEFTASKEAVKYFAAVDFLDLIGKNQLKAKKELENRIRSAINDLKLPLGIEILFIGLMDIHPAMEIAEAYQKVAAAEEEKQGMMLGAESYHVRVLNQVQGQCDQVLLEAEAYFAKQEKLAEGVAKRFQAQLVAYQHAPMVYKLRTYLDMLEQELGHLKKYVVSSKSDEVITIDLQQKIRPDLLDDLDLGQEIEKP